MISANGRGAPGVAAAAAPGGRAPGAGVAAGAAPATVALVADDAGAPTGVLAAEDGAAAAAEVGGGTVAHEVSTHAAPPKSVLNRAERDRNNIKTPVTILYNLLSEAPFNWGYKPYTLLIDFGPLSHSAPN